MSLLTRPISSANITRTPMLEFRACVDDKIETFVQLLGVILPGVVLYLPWKFRTICMTFCGRSS